MWYNKSGRFDPWVFVGLSADEDPRVETSWFIISHLCCVNCSINFFRSLFKCTTQKGAAIRYMFQHASHMLEGWLVESSIRERAIFNLVILIVTWSMMWASCTWSLLMDPTLLWRRQWAWMIHSLLHQFFSRKPFSFLSHGVCSSLWWFECDWLMPVDWTLSHQNVHIAYHSPWSLEPWH